MLKSLFIQRVLTAGTAFNDHAADADAVRFPDIRQRYQQYMISATAHDAATPAGLKRRFGQLRDLDRVVFAWFGQQHRPDLMASPNAAAMRTLVQDTERERDDVVGALVAANQPIPMANLGAGENQANLESMWSRLATDHNSRLRVQTHGATAAADRTKLLSQLAAAMQTPIGRRFITFLVDHAPQTVWVAFDDAVTGGQPGAYAAMATPGGATGLQVEEPTAQPKLGRTRTPAPLAPALANTAADFVRTLMSETIAKAGTGQPVQVREAGGSVLQAGQARQAAAMVSRKRVLADDRSQLSTSTGEEVLTPTFVSLMHELGHALRLAAGVYMPDDADLMAHFRTHLADAEQKKLWQALEGRPNMLEELVNVLGVENPIRAESGLRNRDVYQSTNDVRLMAAKANAEARLNDILADPDVNLYLPLDQTQPRKTMQWHQRLTTATATQDVAAMNLLHNDLLVALASQANDKLAALQAVQTELTVYPPGDATAHTRIARTRRYTQLLAAINAAITAPDLLNPQLQQLSNALTALKNDRKLLYHRG